VFNIVHFPFKYIIYAIFNTNFTMFVFVNYCSNTLWPQLVAIFKEAVSFFDMCSLCAHLSDRNSTCMTEIILKIKNLNH